jgi:hypothetical protein
MRAIFSASSTERALACPASICPGIELVEDESGVAADTGTAFHLLAEAHIDGVCDEPKFPPKADAVRAYRMYERWSPWWDAKHGAHSWITEMPLAYSVRTGRARVLVSRGHRDYSDAQFDEVVGTVDALAVLPDRILLRDWKTGNPRYVTDAARNGQLRLLALAASRAFERDLVEVAPVFVSDLAEPWETPAILDVLDLDLFEEELIYAVELRHTAPPVSGKHCTYCPVADCSMRPKQAKKRCR